MSKKYQSPKLAPGVKEFMNTPKFWIRQNTDLEKAVLKDRRRADFLEETYQRAVDLGLKEEFCRIEDFPSQYSRKELLRIMDDFSNPDRIKDKEYYDFSGKKITAKETKELIANSAVDNIPDKIRVTFGVVVERANVRAYPTEKVFAKNPDTIDQDMLQLTAISVGTPLAVLHTSRDNKWRFIQAPYYRGWVKSKKIAFVENRENLNDYLDPEGFLVVTESMVETEPNPFIPEISNIEFQMGDQIPLINEKDLPEAIPPGNQQAQSPEGCYVIKLPVRDEEGYLQIKPALLARSQGVREGYLPYTREKLLVQAFKMLGERYGWGGLYKRRDCSRFIMDIYRSVGIKIPRDAGKPQEEIAAGETIEFKGDIKQRRETMNQLEPGDPIYMKGHVVMYLGQYQDEHYVIHAASGYGKETDQGIESVTVHGVFVMKAEQYLKSGNKTYLEAFTLARKFK